MENKYTIEIVSQPLYQVDITPTEQFEIDIVAQPQYEVELTGRGPQGVKGDKGDVGPRGPEGPVGPEGPRGPKGDTALTFSVGETTDLQEGEPAYVRNVGTDTDIVLDFGIPKGERGNNGASGKGVDIGSIIQSLSKVAPDGFVHTWGESISQEENPELYQACVDGTLPTVNASNGGVTTIYAPNGIFKQTAGTNTLDINTNVVMELAKIGGVVDWNGSYNPQPSGNITLASLSQNVPTQILMFTEGGQNEVHFRFLEGDYSGKLAEAPSNPSNNTLYFNTNDKTYYIYEGGNWNQYGAEGVGYIWLGAIVVTANPATATWANASFVSTDVTSTGLSEYDQQLVANKGNCGYFGLDTTELSVRVPTMQNVFLEENDTEVGSYKEAGLPNIEGDTGLRYFDGRNISGAFYNGSSSHSSLDSGGSSSTTICFDASRSNPIYSNSDTVQPEAIAVYFYVCVSKYTQLEQGPYFTPHIDSNGILSWTNNGGLVNPPNINIKGPKGEDAFTLAIGEVTTLNPGQQATVTNVGTDGNQVWDIAIPRGESGGSGFSLFDIRTLDYELPFGQSEGWALQGTYVYKNAVAGSRYGYPDFYNKCVEEYQNNSNTKQYLKSNVDFVGSPNDNKGVLNRLSITDYAKFPDDFKPSSNPWELVLKIKTGSTIPTACQMISFQKGLTNATRYGTRLGIQNNRFVISVSYNGTAWDIVSGTTAGATGTYTVLSNTTYYLKYEYTGTAYKVSYSLDGVTYTQDCYVASTKPMYNDNTACLIGLWNNGSFVEPFNGSIDLNESYININGERWWDGVETLAVNPNGHFFYDISQKPQVDDIFNSTGVAWFYGIDTENERVFLPRNDYFDQLTGDVTQVGKFIEAGLPNITGTSNGICTAGVENGSDVSGCIYNIPYQATEGAASNRDWDTKFGIDASLSNPIYGNSDTVQPNAVKKLLYICVGNTTVHSAVTDITEITTSENDTLPLFHNFYSKEDMTTTGAYVNASLGSWLSGNVYATAYNELVNKLGTDNVKSNTDTYTDYDFVVNQDEMTFRLPLKNGQEIMFATGVKGNGMTLGFTNGSENAGSYTGGSDDIRLHFTTAQFGAKVGANRVVGQFSQTLKVVGITPDSTKSGIELDTENITIPDGWNLYYKVANAVENIEVLDVAQVTANLNTKISKTECPAYIVETYINGSSWYRVYSDGWCEQGGIVSAVQGGTKVTFLKPFKNANYTVLSSQPFRGYPNDAYNGGNEIGSITATSCVFYAGDSGTRSQRWEAKGYIA